MNYLLLIIFILVVFVSFDTFFQFFNYSSRDGFGADIFGFKSSWYGRLTGPFGDELIPGSYISKLGLLGFAYLISIKKFEKKSKVKGYVIDLRNNPGGLLTQAINITDFFFSKSFIYHFILYIFIFWQNITQNHSSWSSCYF